MRHTRESGRFSRLVSLLAETYNFEGSNWISSNSSNFALQTDRLTPTAELCVRPMAALRCGDSLTVSKMFTEVL
jgi:hypothetical protein